MRFALMSAVGLLAGLGFATPVTAGVPAIRAEPILFTTKPTYLTHAPGDADRLFIVDRDGVIRILMDGVILETPFLDINTQVTTIAEGGLVGIAFHPEYQRNGYFYLHYTTPAANGLDSVIARFEVTADPNIADPASEQAVLRIDQPAVHHNGGWLGFGPFDGFLYIPVGDGGFVGANRYRAQDTTNVFGSILRVDVDGDDFPADPNLNYAIPPDNPFVGETSADEIWAYGFRNPYRASFDPLTGNLWIGDVGAQSYEEIDVIPAASVPPLNFGWGCMEAFMCSLTACVCNDPSLTMPEFAYDHTMGMAVTAGAVYRGCAIPDLQGMFLVGDYGNGAIWALEQNDGDVTASTNVTAMLQPFPKVTISHIVAISEDAQGELYIVSLDGLISKIVPDTPIVPDPCNPCPHDLDGNGDVGFSDLSQLLAAWGACPGCPEDFDGNDDVGFSDLSALLAQWGPC